MQLSRSLLIEDAILRAKTNIQNKIFPRDLNKRTSSYPFLCPDTYLEYCEISILNDGDLENFIEKTSNTKKFESLYIIGELVNKLISKLNLLNNVRIEKIIIMESDTKQEIENLKNLHSISDEIFSNNLVGIANKITPLPLGLERRAYRSAGVLSHFKSDFSIDPKKRNIDFLIAWNDHTNPKRKIYRKQFSESGKGLVINSRIDPKTIHRLMRKTLFVPSPAGNGLDCHRTWEALYLGAIPVILKSEFCGDSSWPVLVIENWDELTLLSRSELEKLYKDNSLTKSEILDFSHSIIKKVSTSEK